MNSSRQRQDLGAHPQAGELSGGSVHVEAHFAILDKEPNNAAASREILAFTDRENAGGRGRIENAMESLWVALDYKRRARAGKRLIPADTVNPQWPISDGSRLEKVFGGIRRRAFANNDNDERISRPGRRIHRPLDELEKIVDEHRLHLRFAQGSLCADANAKQQRGEDDKSFSNGASL
jgi:hypothetical protein